MNKVDLTLYLVTDRTDKTEDEFLSSIDAACDGGVTLVQLREKNIGGLEYLNLAKKVKLVTDKYGLPLIIDDRVDVAIAADAAGVHVGQTDLPVIEARKLLGPDKIVGATAKTVEQALTAKEQGADYIGVGAIFPTTTKVVTVITKVETLNEMVAASGMQTAAIGGLNSSNISTLYDSSADGIAVVSAIMKSENPREAARKLVAEVKANFKKFKA